MKSIKNVEKIDEKTAKIIKNEIERQRNTIDLIASENFASRAVLEAAGTVLTNKYAEGYPYKRYYGGNKFIDICEEIAIKRAKKIFNAEHANVQPHSGSSANMAAYFALTDWLKKGNKILAMRLDHGGHLSHGSPVNFSGKLFNISFYGVNEKTCMLDYDEIRKIAKKKKPTILLSGASAYPRKIDFKIFKEIADEIGAYHIADIAHIAGLIVAKEHPDAVKYADVVTTTTHKTLRGPRGGVILSKKEYAEAVDKAVFPGIQGGPLEHIIAAKAVCFKEAMSEEFSKYQKQIVKNAKTLAEELINNGLTLITGGTDNHLILVDVSKIGLTGKKAEELLEKVNIIVNKNVIPFDKRAPWDPSGIRIGTPAVTTRGMKESEMEIIGKIISNVLKNPDKKNLIEKYRNEIKELCKEFPLYEEL